MILSEHFIFIKCIKLSHELPQLKLILHFTVMSRIAISKTFSDLSRLSVSSKMSFGIIILLSYIIGTIGKIFIYNHIKSFKMRERPINVLIFIDELIYHSLITVSTFNLVIVLLSGQTPSNFIATYFGIEVNQEVIHKLLKMMDI